jgi:cytochrome bd-type quinol oxidase subunit 2
MIRFMGRAASAVAWHETPPPASGHVTARRMAQASALFYAIATAVFLWAWTERVVSRVCIARDDGPPCPPLPEEPGQWLTTGRWVAWSAGALLVLVALIFAGRASAGRSATGSVWRVLVCAGACGALFSALVLAGP